MNGTGYPHGLNGFEIPAIARVAAITDAFDAITSSRPYKKAVGTFRALTTMRDENVGFYDAELFQYFVRMFGRDSNPSGPETTEQNG
jgi:HD-GYP domain-containing protein (c-di-GMP phosphodiesterase class II)